MRQSKFTETQIVAILKEADAGRPVNEIWRHYAISSRWKACRPQHIGPDCNPELLLWKCYFDGEAYIYLPFALCCSSSLILVLLWPART